MRTDAEIEVLVRAFEGCTLPEGRMDAPGAPDRRPLVSPASPEGGGDESNAGGHSPLQPEPRQHDRVS